MLLREKVVAIFLLTVGLTLILTSLHFYRELSSQAESGPDDAGGVGAVTGPASPIQTPLIGLLPPVNGITFEEHTGPSRMFKLELRGGVDTSAVTWARVESTLSIPAHKMALLVVDTWIDDLFWCDAYVERNKANYEALWRPAIDKARASGVQVLWMTTAETVELYEDHPARQRMKMTDEEWEAVSKVIPKGPVPVIPNVPPVGMRTQDWERCSLEASERHQRLGLRKPTSTWRKELKRIHPAFRVMDEDGLSTERAEIFAFLFKKGIEVLVFAGGATNMCMIYKDYGAATLCAYYGFKCIMTRRLTTVMTPAQEDPEGLKDAEEQMFAYFERFFGPTMDGVKEFLEQETVIDQDPIIMPLPSFFDKSFASSQLFEFPFTNSYTPEGRKYGRVKGSGAADGRATKPDSEGGGAWSSWLLSPAEVLDMLLGFLTVAGICLAAAYYWWDSLIAAIGASDSKKEG